MKNFEMLETSELKGANIESEVILSPIEISLNSLNKITKRLGLFSTLTLIGTLSDLLSCIVIFFKVANYSSSNYRNIDAQIFANFMIFLYVSSFIVILGALYLYESARRRGEVLFEEISDELEWHIDNSGNTKASVRPEINSRISLRSFTRTTDLPFIPGKFGPAFYLTLNIFLIIISTVYVTKIY